MLNMLREMSGEDLLSNSSSIPQDDLPCASPDCGQVKRSFSNRLAQTQSPLPIPGHDLQPIALGVAEQEQVPAHSVTRKSTPDPTVQSLEPLAHVGDSDCQIDPRGLDPNPNTA